MPPIPRIYNNNAAPIMRGCRIHEKAKEMRAKALFTKFSLSKHMGNLLMNPEAGDHVTA